LKAGEFGQERWRICPHGERKVIVVAMLAGPRASISAQPFDLRDKSCGMRVGASERKRGADTDGV
jgi:hypothetical protein